MKKFYSLFVLALLALTAQAQDDLTWWGYYTNQQTALTGTYGLGDYEVAMFIPGDGDMKGVNIEAIRVQTRNYSFTKDFKFWIRTSLDGENIAEAIPAEVTQNGTTTATFTEAVAIPETGIYVGSTKDGVSDTFTYGGFVYTNKLTLKDKFIMPDGTHFQECEAAHGNITYVSTEVVERMGIFCEKYHHGGAYHDYTYLAHKAGFPVLVLPHYSGVCENDHPKDSGIKAFFGLPLKERINALHLHNTLLFNRRCFPWRYPIILLSGYFKALMPKTYYWLYLFFRK